MKKFMLQLTCAGLLGAILLAISNAAPATRPAADTSIATLEAQTIAIAPKCVASTVGLVSTVQVGNGFAVASGSGVIVSADGLILTAGHVIQQPGNKLTVRFVDGRVVQGVAVGLDHKADTGLARITDPAPIGGWAFSPMAPEDSARVGEWVLATGNPGSIVVDRDPPLRIGRVSGRSDGMVGTNCALEPGDSGGPLFDLSGRVVGINSQIFFNEGTTPSPEYLSLHVAIGEFSRQWKDLLAGMNANPDFLRDARYGTPKPVPGISAGTRAALNELAAQKDPDAVQALADEKKNNKLTIKPDLMAKLLKLAAQRDRAGIVPATAPGATPKVASGSATTAPATTQSAQAAARERTGGIVIDRAWVEAGKTSLQTLSLFVPAITTAGDCVVEIRNGAAPTLLGTVVGSDGLIVSKASDLPADPRIILSDGRTFTAKVVGKDTATDLALLKIDTTGLTAVNFANAAPLGTWLCAPTADPNEPAIGVVSLAARPIAETFAHFEGEQKLVLGLRFGITGVIEQIISGMPAEAAGMKAGDEIFQLNGQPIANPEEFTAALKKAKPGDTLSIMVHRAGKTLELKPVIGKGVATTQTASSIGEDDNVAGGKLSKRRTNFPLAIQTDAAIWADQCGGPLINLRGQTVGIIIARYDRSCTFALPAQLVQSTVAKLEKSN